MEEEWKKSLLKKTKENVYKKLNSYIQFIDLIFIYLAIKKNCYFYITYVNGKAIYGQWRSGCLGAFSSIKAVLSTRSFLGL